MKEILEKKYKLQDEIKKLIDSFAEEIENESVIINIEVTTSFVETVYGKERFSERGVKVTIEI